MSAPTAREISRRWTGQLAHYRTHQHDEHREALVAEAFRFVGFRLENDLTHSDHWSMVPLARRVSLLLFLVDRGVVARVRRNGRPTYEPVEDATNWVLAQPSLVPYLIPTLEFLSALQAERVRSARPATEA